MKNLLSLISNENKRDLNSSEIAKLTKGMIKEISLNSEYSKEEAAAIWGGAPNYLETLHYYSKGADIKDLAINLLNKLK